MLILDTKDPDSLFVDQVVPALAALKNTTGCVINLRKNKDSYYHDLSLAHEFRDAIERYSYYAKTNQKAYVPKTIKKAFNTSQIKHIKYYDLSDENMINIRKIDKNEELTFDNAEVTQVLDADIKTQKTRGNDVKLCFSLDDKRTRESIGFYSLSYAYDYGHDWFNIYFSIDQLHISASAEKYEWFDAVYVHLSEKITKALASIQERITTGQILTIEAVALDSPELEEVLNLAVFNACDELSIVRSTVA